MATTASLPNVSPAAVADPPAIPRRRVGVLVAVVVVAGLAAAGLLAARPWGRPATPPEADTPVAAAATIWPAPTRNDFGLTVEFVAVPQKDAAGAQLLPDKTPLQIRIRADRDCHAAVFSLQADGEVVRIFPNRWDPDDLLVAGQTRVIPPDVGYTVKTTLTPINGTDRLRAIASTGALPLVLTGNRDGSAYPVFRTESERTELAKAVEVSARGLVVEGAVPPLPEDRQLVSEAEVIYRVVPK